MEKGLTRKQFLKLSAMAGAGLLIQACSGEEAANESAKKDTTPAPKLPAEENAGTQVEIIDARDKRYDSYRRGYNLRINKRPAYIALPKNTAEVAEAVRFAVKNKLPVAIKSGGHSMEGLSCNDGCLVINLSKMSRMEMPDEETLIAEPGCILMQLYDFILPKGKIIPAGSCGTVGLGGLTTGGGYGLFSRQMGLTCDSLLEATMVDGKGTIHSTAGNPELLWALRGGGSGNFGVVTELKFRLHKAPETMQVHYFKSKELDAVKAKELLQTWFTTVQALPLRCFSDFVLNGKTLNVVITNPGPDDEALTPVIHSLQSAMADYRPGKRHELARMLRNHYGSLKPVRFKNSSAGLYSNFSEIEPVIERVFEQIILNPGMIFQVNTLGGKINDEAFESGSCFPHRGKQFVSELQAYWENPASGEKLEKISKQILEQLYANGNRTQYFNYCSLDFKDWETAYYGDNYARLQEIKKRYDPENTICHAQSVRI